MNKNNLIYLNTNIIKSIIQTHILLNKINISYLKIISKRF
jgi:hypothetical protein